MRRLRFALRFSVLAIIGILMLGTMGSLSLADAFDKDYEDCPSGSRLDALSGLRASRTDEEDELKVSWAMTDPASWGLGRDYRSQITIIVEGTDDEKTSLALGRNEYTFDGIEFADDLTVSVAVVRDGYVISDIAVTEFTSGLPKPKFTSPFYLAQAQTNDVSIFRADIDDNEDDNTKRALKYIFDGDGDVIEKRAKAVKESTFYYLGFNHNFDNWYVNTGSTYPKSPKFRVGLRHGTEEADAPGDADFEHFRIRVTDSSGEDVLGFDAITTTDNRAYGDQVLVIGSNERPKERWNEAGLALDETASTPTGFSSIKQSNRIDDNTDAYYNLTGSFWDMYFTGSGWIPERIPQIRSPGADVDDTSDDVVQTWKLSYQNVMHIDKIGTKGTSDLLQDNRRQLFALPPVEIYDLPVDIFADDGNYTIEAWAENDDGDTISPRASITLSVREQFHGDAQSSLDLWKRDAFEVTNHDPDTDDRLVEDQYFNQMVRQGFALAGGYREGTILGLSIQAQ